MSGDFPVVVVGAGQAGLAVSHELAALGIDHVVLERARVGETWRRRWDSFCLVTPNWTMRLPGARYGGDDPEGFVPRDEIVQFLERYASSFAAPVREGVGVDSVESGPGGGFLLRTGAGDMQAEAVVVCTGAYQRPHRPDVAADLPHDVVVIDAEDYRNPTALPPGKVLVVGSGQTGCQLSEELHDSGRDVFLACGRAPWMPRRASDRDLVTWISETTFFDTPLSALPSPAARLGANPQATGRGGWPRSALPHAAGDGCRAPRPLGRRARATGLLRGRFGRLRGLRRCALCRPQTAAQPAARRQGRDGARAARPLRRSTPIRPSSSTSEGSPR